jgi:hypothetical protein
MHAQSEMVDKTITAFILKGHMADNKFQHHPFKKEILDRWDKGQNIMDVYNFLKNKDEERFYISYNTLAKYYKRYKSAHLKPRGIEEKESRVVDAILNNKEEEYLWETIEQCRQKKLDKTISPKDWQYYDMQMQSAIKLLADIKHGASPQDLSLMLSKLADEIKAEDAEQGTTEEKAGSKVSGDVREGGQEADAPVRLPEEVHAGHEHVQDSEQS